MRPIPWIVLALVVTAIGIGWALYMPIDMDSPDRLPRRIHFDPYELRAMAAASIGESDVVEIPEDAPVGTVANETVTMVPEPKVCQLPVINGGELLVPRPNLRLVVVTVDGEFVYYGETPPPVLSSDPVPEPHTYTITDLEGALAATCQKLATQELPQKLEVCLLIHLFAKWDLKVKPLLDACGRAGIDRVQLGCLQNRYAKEVAAISYQFFRDGEGALLPVLAPRDKISSGAILELLPRSRTSFLFGEKERKRAASLIKDMKELYEEEVDFEGAGYSDSGRVWTIRAAKKTSYQGLVEAAAALEKVGIKRYGIETQ
jgi:hypothetical protein